MLLGGDGDDRLHGGQGRDLLIGGLGSDSLTGNAGDDILIAGLMSHDNNAFALGAIMAETLDDLFLHERYEWGFCRFESACIITDVLAAWFGNELPASCNREGMAGHWGRMTGSKPATGHPRSRNNLARWRACGRVNP